MPDADWILTQHSRTVAFCQKEGKNTTPSYIMRVSQGPLDYYSTALDQGKRVLPATTAECMRR